MDNYSLIAVLSIELVVLGNVTIHFSSSSSLPPPREFQNLVRNQSPPQALARDCTADLGSRILNFNNNENLYRVSLFYDVIKASYGHQNLPLYFGLPPEFAETLAQKNQIPTMLGCSP